MSNTKALRTAAQQALEALETYPYNDRHWQECRPVIAALRAALAQPATFAAPPGWTDADADAARLALELECLLTDKATPMETVSRWWDSAHEALELHRARMAAAPDAQKGAQP